MTTTTIGDARIEIVGIPVAADNVSPATLSGETVSSNSAWSVLEAVDTAIAVTRSNGTVVFANALLAQLVGKPAAAIVGTRVFRLFDGNSREELERLHAETLLTAAQKRTEAACAQDTAIPFLARLALRRADRPKENFVVWSIAEVNPPTWRGTPPELALRGAEVGLWDWDIASDCVTWLNDWCGSMDLDPCEGPQHFARWTERIHPDDLPVTLGFEALIEGRSELYEAEYRTRMRDGGWRWVLCRGRATVRDGSRRALRIAGVAVDIDARKRAELALRETEVRLETAIWGGDIGLWDKGSDGQFRFLNDWCDRIDIDYPCDGRDQYARWRAQIHPDDVQRHAQAKDDFYRGGANQYGIEYRVRTRGGQWRWLLERGKVLSRDRDGSAERIVGVCIDISEHKKNRGRAARRRRPL